MAFSCSNRKGCKSIFYKEGSLALLDEMQVKVKAIACFGDYDMPEEERTFLPTLRARGIEIVSLMSWSEIAKLQYEAGTIDKEMYDWMVLRLSAVLFADDQQGLLTKSVDFLRRRGVKFPKEIKDFLITKGVDVSGV